MSEVSFCVHGHFYQPDREDPISGEIPNETGAIPFKNWNELIFHHCYKPNAELRNFEKISFNMGPTLIDWMEKTHPDTELTIINQHKLNYEKHGVGNAMAQPYHHTILPLASYQDKVTQILWGIEDFKRLYGHSPTGMWLPETAVDMESLSIMAENGIEFTILAPWQADTENLDVTQPYWVELPNNLKIAVFFYHREMSTLISFNPTSTINADRFVKENLVPNLGFSDNTQSQKIFLVATDGELYGHHQPFRDKFLAQLMDGALVEQKIDHTFPALWLRKNPPIKTIRIRNNTSWSCHHGVARWSVGCDCTQNSEWKGKLRSAIEIVAKIIDEEYVGNLSSLVENIWDLRNSYIQVILGQISETDFIKKKIGEDLSEDEFNKIALLLKAQMNRQRMFTSCGWFFENFDRLEPHYMISYAVQALFLTEQVSGKNYTEEVLPYFKQIQQSNSVLAGSDIFLNQYQKTKIAFAKK